MADFQFESRADFEKMVDAQIEETLTIEYKASPALTRNSKDVDELYKDVSAMANSAGGQIIYGIEEDKKTHKPSKVDDGCTDDKITREWMHQILSSRIQPRIDRVGIQRIALSASGGGFVITVPQSLTGPHQAPDKKYYKRFELEAKAMEDYEIRDIMRRATTPDLEVQLSLSVSSVEFASHQELSKTFFLNCTVINKSPTPANYAIVELFADYNIINPFQVNPFIQTGEIDEPPAPKFRIFCWTIASPPGVPIFKEAVHETHKAQLALQIPSSMIHSNILYFETDIKAPGVSKHEEWAIMVRNARLQLLYPGHPMMKTS